MASNGGSKPVRYEQLMNLPVALVDEWEAHEGMVTVYHADGRYAGCMGIERWRELLRTDREQRT